jgi:hypothetical protein
MAMYSAKTYSAQVFRQIEPLRVVLDAVDGLQADKSEIAEVAGLPNDRMTKWAKNYRVRYETAVEGDSSKIVLVHD